VLDKLYNQVKDSKISVPKGRKLFAESQINWPAESNDRRFDLVTRFLDNAKDKRNT
jgi:hypothetical protein